MCVPAPRTSDTSFSSDTVTSWAEMVEVVTGSCSPEMPQLITPHPFPLYSKALGAMPPYSPLGP